MLKFKVSPSVTAAAVPTGTGFGAFAGAERKCKLYAPAKGGVLRCKEFASGAGKPICPDRQKGKTYKLVDGGRSPHLVRAGPCPGSRDPKTRVAAVRAAPAKRKSAKRKQRK